MEMAAKVKTELAFSGLFSVVSILNKNFRVVITTEEMKPLNDFVDYKIEELTRKAISDDLVQLMPSLKELQASALKLKDQLDLHEYYQIEKQVNSSSSEPTHKEKVLPKDLRDGLNELLKIVERVENIRQSITSKKGTAQSDSFVDFLVGEYHVARPVIKLALSDISRLIEMLGSNFRYSFQEILEQLEDVVSYHIQALIVNVNFNYLTQAVQLLDILQVASFQLGLFNQSTFDRYKRQFTVDPNEFDYTPKLISSSYSIPLERFKPKLKEEFGPIIFKSPLRIGLEKLLKFIKKVEINHSSIISKTGITQPQVGTITPTFWIRIGVEKWLKFVKEVEKEHPFITTKKDTTCPQDHTFTPISTVFFPGRGFLSTTNLENGKCQEDAEEIMRNHKNNLKELIFGWTDIASSTGTCKEVLERLEPGQNPEKLSIINYSCSKFPNWMEKKNWLPRLQKLTLRSCTSLKIVSFLPPHLERLDVEICHELMQLPLFSHSLRSVKLIDCPKLAILGNLQRCTSLESLTISFCPKLKRKYGMGGPLRHTISHICEVSIH